MKKNVGIVDRWLRFVPAIVVAALTLGGVIPPIVAIVLGIVAVVLLLTSIVGYCPLYHLFGLSTRKGR
jgi:hypothetical protein